MKLVMRSLAITALSILIFSSGTSQANNQKQIRACDEWNARYVNQPDDDGSNVYAEFGKAQGSEPMPFTLTGVDRAGTRTWQYKTVAWCFLGYGGCHVGLRK